MKMTWSIGLAFFYFFSTTGMVEVTKVPELMDHYAMHIEEEGELSFFEFLKLHYSDEEHQNSDEHPHNLPFQNVESNVLMFAPSLPQQMHSFVEHSSFWKRVGHTSSNSFRSKKPSKSGIHHGELSPSFVVRFPTLREAIVNSI